MRTCNVKSNICSHPNVVATNASERWTWKFQAEWARVQVPNPDL